MLSCLQTNYLTYMPRRELIANYSVQSPMPGDFVAELIAGEQSSGTFAPLAGETKELKARARARVVRVTETEASGVPLYSAMLERKSLLKAPQRAFEARR